MKTPEQFLSDKGLEPSPIDNWMFIYYPSLVGLLTEYADQFKPKPQPEQPTPERIRSVIAQFHDLTDEQITMSCNRPEIVEPRQLAMTLIKIGLGKSLAFTGVELGNFDHATVLNAIKRVHERYTCYNHYRIMVDSLVAELFPSADQQQYITDRIIDPHKDRRNVLSKFTPQTA